MAIIIDVMQEEMRRLTELKELYLKEDIKRYLDKIPRIEEDLKLYDYLLEAYHKYES